MKDSEHDGGMSAAGEGGEPLREDAATRQRLLDAAIRLFAEHGYPHVTVRALSREADVNLAAVNYHFGGKLQLYREVVGGAFDRMRQDPMITPPEGASAEERLRHYVRAYVPRLIAPTEDGVWFSKLMRHEMMEPTPLAPWIAERVILPRLRYLSKAVAEMLDTATDDGRVVRCVMSLQAQCLFYLPSAFREAIFPERPRPTPEEIDEIVEHIGEFTLAGIRRYAR